MANESENGGCKAVFLDRDGTINVDKDYLYKKEEFEYMQGAVEGMRELVRLGFRLVIITNQSGIARGYYTEVDYKYLDEWMKEDLRRKGIELAGTYYCPHLPDSTVTKYRKNCICRKPKTGLFWRACRELAIDMNRSFVVGDRLRDLCICNESGVRGILIQQKQISKEAVTYQGISVCSNWCGVVKEIKRQLQIENVLKK